MKHEYVINCVRTGLPESGSMLHMLLLTECETAAEAMMPNPAREVAPSWGYSILWVIFCGLHQHHLAPCLKFYAAIDQSGNKSGPDRRWKGAVIRIDILIESMLWGLLWSGSDLINSSLDWTKPRWERVAARAAEWLEAKCQIRERWLISWSSTSLDSEGNWFDYLYNRVSVRLSFSLF